MNMKQKQGEMPKCLTLFKHHQLARFRPGLRMIMDDPFTHGNGMVKICFAHRLTWCRRIIVPLKLAITSFNKFTCTVPTIACTYQVQGVHLHVMPAEYHHITC